MTDKRYNAPVKRKKNFFSLREEHREIKYGYKCLIDEGTIKIMAFSKYSVIAEKFETLIETLATDTYAKDFYDIYKLMSDDIDSEKLYKAIYNTFKRKDTLDLPKNLKTRLNIIK